MESFPFFFKIRAIAFTCIMLFSFLWLVLLSVEVYARWSVSDQICRSLMIVFILTNTITLLLLPMLILVQFRIWLDAARLLFLFLLQVGSAAAGTFWSPKIQCPDQTPDDVGVCQLIGVYTMMACWIIPAILGFYLTYFAVVVYLQSRIPVVVEPRCHSGDLERGSTDSPSSWRENMNEIVRAQDSNIECVISRSPVLPSMVHVRQSSLPHASTSQRQSTLPNSPRHQSTMPSSPLADQRPFLSLHPVSGRHRSLPASNHASRAHLRPMLTLSVARPLPLAPHSQTPSSHSFSTPSSANPQSQPSPSFGPSIADAQSSKGSTRHLSMMPLSSSPKEMQSAEGSPTTRSSRTRLSKPPPIHFM